MSGYVNVINVKDPPYSAAGDGITDDTAAVGSARAAATAAGVALYFPAGTYLVDSTALDYNADFTPPPVSPQARLELRGDSSFTSKIKAVRAGQTIVHLQTDAQFSQGIEISHLAILGNSSMDPQAAHGIHLEDSTGTGPSHLFLHDLSISGFSRHGIYLPGEWHTLIQDVSIDDCGDNLFELGGGNSTTLIRTYAQRVYAGKVGYRIYGGFVSMIGCTGINSDYQTTNQQQADWGVFGLEVLPAWLPNHAYTIGQLVQHLAQEYEVITAGTSGPTGPGPTISPDIADPNGTVHWRHIGGADADFGYFRGTLIGCDVEDFTRHGIRLKPGSSINLISTSFLAPAGGTGYIPLWAQYIDPGVSPSLLDGQSAFLSKGGTYANNAAIHGTVGTEGILRLGGAGTAPNAYLRTYPGGLTYNVPGLSMVGNGFGRNAISAERLQVGSVLLTLERVLIPYSTTMTPDIDTGNQFVISANNGVAFTINTPTGSPAAGMRITLRILNTRSSGNLGAATWGTGYKLSAWTQPSSGNSRAIDFQYDGSHWIEVSRTAGNVPN